MFRWGCYSTEKGFLRKILGGKLLWKETHSKVANCSFPFCAEGASFVCLFVFHGINVPGFKEKNSSFGYLAYKW